MASFKPLRTALFVPGNRPDRVRKALNSPADAVIIDLEDAVPYSEKQTARLLVREIIDSNRERRTYVRVNDLATKYIMPDLEAVVCENITGIMLPKVERPEEIFEIDKMLCERESTAGLPIGNLEVIPIIESAKGVQEIYRIVSARPERQRVGTVAFGAADFTLDLGIELTREGMELAYPRAWLAVACRAGGIMPPLDSPWMLDIHDIDGLIAEAKRAKALGFQGKLVIHPNQIEPCHEVFTPSAEEIAQAQKVIRAFEKAEREGKAAIQLDGKFFDYAVVKRSKRICELAKIIGNQSLQRNR
ncbi:MAG: CoA ester lyase [Desulfobacteraceae bacterium]|nr:CoA ester lyase [Desulfobacteraceae bacterium]